MFNTYQFAKLTTVLSAALLLVACSSVQLDDKKATIEEGIPSTVNSTGSNNVTTGSTGSNLVTVKTNPNAQATQPDGPLAKRSVYFDYDSYVIKDDYQAIIQAHAKNLISVKDKKVVIEGNTEERGSREYNLALGQKRAEAVRKALSVLGVSDSQLEAISNGEEKPKALGNDEAAYAENRRADIVYK